MKKLALLAFTLFSAWNMDAKTITGQWTMSVRW